MTVIRPSLLAIALAVLTSCGGDRTAVLPMEVPVTVQVRLGHWSWLPDHWPSSHQPGEGAATTTATAATPAGADHTHAAARPGAAAGHQVLVQIGFADEVYDSMALDDLTEPTPALAALGVSNWIRVVDGTRTIDVGHITGREGSRIIIELGPGISAFAY